MILLVAFWLLAGVVLYVYAGYPLIVQYLGRRNTGRRLPGGADFFPFVSLIITAYNEEDSIREKIINSLSLAYPHDRLEIIVASDGSTDRTDEIVQEFAHRGIRLVRLPSNKGKSAAQNAGVAHASGEVVVFCDADVELDEDTLAAIIRPFADRRVGCVTGKIRYVKSAETGVTRGENLYWRYEFNLRKQESDFGNLAMGSGLLAIRKKLFKPLDSDVGDDFVLPMKTAVQGYRVVFEPDARGRTMLYQSHAEDMFATKLRIITKDLRGLFFCKEILNPFAHPFYAWGLLSHKLLRWLVPYFLIGLFAVSLALRHLPFYGVAVIAQAVFYTLALVNLAMGARGRELRLLYIPSCFFLINSAAFLGVIRFVTGGKSGRWQPVR